MPYGQPILQIYTSDPTASDNRAVPFIITDDNRAALSLTYDRIEQSARMADGTMRRFITANKRKISTSWDNIPAAGGINYTSDGYLSGAFLKSFFEENVYNPVWIKLTYSEEAWRSASNTVPTNRYGYINSTYDKTISNTALPKEAMIEDVGTGVISGSTGPAYVITKTDHGITPGDDIYIKGIAPPFNGTWKTSSTTTFASIMSSNYDLTVTSSSPLMYLKLESTTITDSGPYSGSVIISPATGTTTASGLYENTVVSTASIAYTSASGSTESFLSLNNDFTIEFWHKGSPNSAASAVGLDVIRKLPSNLISNGDFNSNADNWTVTPTSTFALNRDTFFKLTGDGSARIDNPQLSSVSSSVYYNPVPVVANLPYSLSGFINWQGGGLFPPSTIPFTAMIQWQNSSGSVLSSSVGTSTSLSAGGWNRISASGVAPTSATKAVIVFVKGDGILDRFYMDNVLFEQSASVKDYTGWAIQRDKNNQMKFKVYPYRGTQPEIIVPNMYDDNWHHVAFRTSVLGGDDNTDLKDGYTKMDVWIDGELYRYVTGTGRTFQGSSAPHEYLTEPVRINHGIDSGIRDNIVIHGKWEPENGIIRRSKEPTYFRSIPESRALVFNFNQDGNPLATFGVNSYIYNSATGSNFTFNIDSTQLISVGDRFLLSNFSPATGSTSFATTTFTVTGKDSDNETTFSASGSPEVTGNGNGYGGYAILISSYPMMKSLAPTAQPVVGTAVASDIIKVFMTSFDYTINKRFKLTDYVDVSLEFTEI